MVHGHLPRLGLALLSCNRLALLQVLPYHLLLLRGNHASAARYCPLVSPFAIETDCIPVTIKARGNLHWITRHVPLPFSCPGNPHVDPGSLSFMWEINAIQCIDLPDRTKRPQILESEIYAFLPGPRSEEYWCKCHAIPIQLIRSINWAACHRAVRTRLLGPCCVSPL